jgi:ubiquinone/menaquinone biosynthesis C-methylase UbiE
MMAVIKGLEWTFNTVAAAYDKWSPNYIPELYQDIFAYKPIGQASNVLEIGIGTGQATAPILETGCTLTAVELGDKLAEIVRQKFNQYPKFSVVTTAFQNFECPACSFDLIYSARAFHWIPEEYGYINVYRMLKPGGAFARFATHSYYVKEEEELNTAIQKVYTEYMPGNALTPQYTEEDAKRRSDVAAKYGFIDVAYRLYGRTRTYNAEEYTSLIGIYSDHIVLEERKKPGFYSGIREAIENYGGTITLQDTVELNLARKP